ncbi:mitochondria-eating protein isoform X2 [Aplysia californica]|uniref:Mitochondria-eating protein n=1 Tax=Aplysia californica TaxID=6500 RepID=A0ABM0ZWC4_APLCA|nr:mitochondria-eating protein isoform X2 [Aplysia californica]
MAESLRRLVNIETFSVLQEKLEKWQSDYYVNTCDQNTARCCEIIELNAKVQGQLFKLLSLCAQEGGMYGGANIIKSRLLPWLGQNFFTSGGAVTADTSLSVLAEAAAKDRELSDLQEMYEKSLDDLDIELQSARNENQDLKDELQETKLELDRSVRASSSDKMFTELEVNDLKRKLASAEDEVRTLRTKSGLLAEYQTEVRRLRDDIALLSARRDVLLRTPELSSYEPVRSKLEDKLSDLSLYYRYIPGPTSPLSIDDTLQRIRQQNLIARFNDMFAQDRLSTMDTLRRYSDDHENNQRIIFACMQEAFNTAKVEFRSFKMKTRANLAKTHYGPDTLEEAVQDYINRNIDLYDLPGMVSDVIRGLNRNPKIFLPPDTSYAVCQPFIREAVKLAWQMSALAHPLDIAVATDAELFDDTKYRRSYDSEYTAPLVNHHIWPCLVQGVRVLVKGEALTKRGASLGSPRRARSPARAASPVRALSPIARSLSPSRFRSRSPSPGQRARSPARRARFT